MKFLSVFLTLLYFASSIQAQEYYDVSKVYSDSSASPNHLLELQTSSGTTNAHSIKDTLVPIPLNGCDLTPVIYTWGSSVSGYDDYLTGTGWCDEVAQMVNPDSLDLKVHSILAFIGAKQSAGHNTDFIAHLYLPTDSLTPDYTYEATSKEVSFNNISTTGFTRFEFDTPVSTKALPVFLSVVTKIYDPIYLTDYIGILSTKDSCGGRTAFCYQQNAWSSFWSSYKYYYDVDLLLYLFAEVESNNVGMDRFLISKEGVDFYPNPAKSFGTIKVNLPTGTKVELFVQDIHGTLIHHSNHSLVDHSLELDLESYAPGIYTFQIKSDNGQFNSVFIKD